MSRAATQQRRVVVANKDGVNRVGSAFTLATKQGKEAVMWEGEARGANRRREKGLGRRWGPARSGRWYGGRRRLPGRYGGCPVDEQ
ncbi:hypothetical protein NL676_007195 [Syzygium grande]|nr:hypothetical protein NL676_007195 [Syzygium grande]